MEEALQNPSEFPTRETLLVIAAALALLTALFSFVTKMLSLKKEEKEIVVKTGGAIWGWSPILGLFGVLLALGLTGFSWITITLMSLTYVVYMIQFLLNEKQVSRNDIFTFVVVTVVPLFLLMAFWFTTFTQEQYQESRMLRKVISDLQGSLSETAKTVESFVEAPESGGASSEKPKGESEMEAPEQLENSGL